MNIAQRFFDFFRDVSSDSLGFRSISDKPRPTTVPKPIVSCEISLEKSKKRQAITPLLQKVIDSTMNLAYFSKTTLDDSSGGIGGLRRSGSALGGSGGALGGGIFSSYIFKLPINRTSGRYVIN